MKSVNLTGKRFGKLLVLEYDHSNKGVYWLCSCDCGNTTVVSTKNLNYGSTRSCGCGSKEQALINCSKSRYKHGMSNTRIYGCWKNMKSRCYSANNKRYKNYGGRNISVCDKWVHNFDEFYKWALLNGYNDTLTIERIDVNGNYSPQNCKWIPFYEQQLNTTRSRYVTYKEQTHTLAEWARIFDMPPHIVCGRLTKGWTMEEVEKVPIGGKRRDYS